MGSLSLVQVSEPVGLRCGCLAARLMRRSNKNHTCAIQRRETQRGPISTLIGRTADGGPPPDGRIAGSTPAAGPSQTEEKSQ